MNELLANRLQREGWPPESIECQKRFGRPLTRLYPFLRDSKKKRESEDELPRWRAPQRRITALLTDRKGRETEERGILLSVTESGARVLLDKEVRRAQRDKPVPKQYPGQGTFAGAVTVNWWHVWPEDGRRPQDF